MASSSRCTLKVLANGHTGTSGASPIRNQVVAEDILHLLFRCLVGCGTGNEGGSYLSKGNLLWLSLVGIAAR
jgi:hypothetical protein